MFLHVFVFLCGILAWIYNCVNRKRSGKTVYLLDPKDTERTRNFATQFEKLFGRSITFRRVNSVSACEEGHRIALLCIRLTDRASEDIESILDIFNRDYNQRTVLIYIHVRQHKEMLPKTATRVCSSEFGDHLCDIFDFGLINESIEECVYDGKIKSKEAFKNFVMAENVDFTPKTGYSPLP